MSVRARLALTALAALVLAGCDEKAEHPTGSPAAEGPAEQGSTPQAQGAAPSDEPPHLRQPRPRPSTEEVIREEVFSRVAQGYETRAEIIEDGISTVDPEEIPDAGYEEWEARMMAQIGQVTDEALAAHKREEASWKTPTDCDRLDLAFARLEKSGILARQKYADCQTCGVDDIRREMEAAHKKGRKVVGYTFFHDQDVDEVLDSKTLYLAYGSYADNEETTAEVGRQVVSALHAAGLKTQWSGSTEDRIALVDLDWRRRRHGH